MHDYMKTLSINWYEEHAKLWRCDVGYALPCPDGCEYPIYRISYSEELNRYHRLAIVGNKICTCPLIPMIVKKRININNLTWVEDNLVFSTYCWTCEEWEFEKQ